MLQDKYQTVSLPGVNFRDQTTVGYAAHSRGLAPEIIMFPRLKQNSCGHRFREVREEGRVMRRRLITRGARTDISREWGSLSHDTIQSTALAGTVWESNAIAVAFHKDAYRSYR